MSEDVATEVEALAAWAPDRRRIVVRVLDSAVGGVSEVWTAHLGDQPAGRDLPLDMMAELAVALRAGGRVASYSLSARRTYRNWGADACWEDIVLEVGRMAFGGVAGGIAYDALRRTIATLVAKARAGRESMFRRSFDGDEAAERGRWVLKQEFGLSDAEVGESTVAGADEVADGSRVVRYQLGERRFEVELVEQAGLVSIARVGWNARPGPAPKP